MQVTFSTFFKANIFKHVNCGEHRVTELFMTMNALFTKWQ